VDRRILKSSALGVKDGFEQNNENTQNCKEQAAIATICAGPSLQFEQSRKYNHEVVCEGLERGVRV
jgi:hypothetical protein